jgi:CheY-like chemotaxis protein
MSDDLISLRMLVACDNTADRDMWRGGAGLASTQIHVTEAATGIEAAVALKNAGADIVVVDSGLAGADALIKQAREQVPAPVVLAVTDGLPAAGELAKPGDVEAACALINRFLKMRLPTRVMVVDDSATTRAVVRKILGVSRFTLTIAEATDGSAALEQIKTGSIDVVLLDCNMPGQDGVETLTQIKREHPQIAVVMMTSRLDQGLIERASKAGAESFLKKPFFPKDIDQMLARHHELGAID